MCEQHVNNEWSAKQINLGNLTKEQVLNLNGQRKKTQIIFDVRSLPREKKKMFVRHSFTKMACRSCNTNGILVCEWFKIFTK